MSLSPRKWRQRELLAIVARINDRGILPSKMAVCVEGRCGSNMTRSRWYGYLDELLAGGYLVNRGGERSAYELEITETGRKEV